MKKKQEVVLLSLAMVALIAALWWHLQANAEFLFYYREQRQIFLNDSPYVMGLLAQVGGFATVLAQWVTQFFSVPGVGAGVTAALSAVSFVAFALTLRRVCPSPWLLPVALIPILFQDIALIQPYYRYEGLVALCLMSLSWLGYALLSDRACWQVRALAGGALALGLFFLVGPVATLFVGCALLYDVLKRRPQCLATLLLPLVVAVAAFVCVRNGAVVGYDYALWVRGYDEYFMPPDWLQHATWASVLLLPVFFRAVQPLANRLRPKAWLWACSLLLLCGEGYFYVRQSDSYNDKDLYVLMQLMDDINHERWDSILDNGQLNSRNMLHMNCLNLALAHKGELATKLFAYPQSGVQSLMTDYQAFNDVNVLFSHIYYRMGILGEALYLSFGTMVATPDGNPSILKLLIKERLIYGDYDVAEKYISRLEKTWGYASWAARQRRFLYDDQAVLFDPELGAKRRSLPPRDTGFVAVKGLFSDLMRVLSTNPTDAGARDYAIAYLLLTKDVPSVKLFVEQYYGTDVLPALPVLLQEAVAAYAENDSGYCREHGVSEETLQRIAAFRKRTAELRQANQNLQAGLSAYRSTFWYYLMFK